VTRRERVLAALRGEPVDRLPLAFWLHDFAAENDVTSFVAETRRLATTFGWDYLKPQSRAQCFAEAWGLRYALSGRRDVQYTRTHAPCASAADLRRLGPAEPTAGALGEQLEALRQIRAAVGADTPIIWTVFSPMMVVPFLLTGGVEQAVAIAREAPDALDHALAAITDTLTRYAREALATGADGLFYATNVARRGLLTSAECRRFQRPWDLRVLEAAAAAPFNVLHVCGRAAHLDEFVDYPFHALSWAASEDNASLSDVRRRTGRAVIGGLPGKPLIATLSARAIADHVRAAARETGSRGLLLGPECSINPDTPEPLLHAARLD
jgi:uroporphyrinogen decarboxylase